MKKFLFAACLFSGFISLGAAQTETKDSVIFHESFDMRKSSTDLPANDQYGSPQEDPNFYKYVKENWNMLNYDGNTYTFEGDPMGEDANGEQVSYYSLDGTSYCTAGLIRNWMYSNIVDDWLIMKKPVKVKVGEEFHVAFYAKNERGYIPVEVWYGTTDRPNYTSANTSAADITKKDNNWNLLGTSYVQDAFDQTWQLRYSPVGKVEATGVDSVDIYFAVRISIPDNSENKGSWFRIDEFSVIRGGIAGGVPDIELSKVILPDGGCELQEAPITLDITNNSDFSVKGFACSIELYCDDEEVTTINDTNSTDELASGETKSVTFNKKIPFTTTGSYEVVATISLLDSEDYGKETELANNLKNAFVDKHDGLKIPVEFAFWGQPSIDEGGYKGEEAAAQWYFDENAWHWNGNGFTGLKPSSPMKSTCIKLDAGTLYSFKWKYLVGSKYIYGGKIYEEHYAWFVGPSSSTFDPNSSDWKIIKEATEYVSSDDYKEQNFTFDVDEAGSYQFVLYVYPNANSGESTYAFRFNLDYVYISEAGVDFGIDEFYFPGMAFNTPRYMMKGEHEVVARVSNYGVGNDHKGKVNVYLGEKTEANLLGSSEEFTIEEKGQKEISFKVNIPEDRLKDFSDVEKNNFLATVEIVGDEDTYTGNQDDSYAMKVTDSVLSFFTVDVPEYYTYFYTKGGLGIMFDLKEVDTLTQIAVGINAEGAGAGSNANYDVVVRAVTSEGENQKFNLGATYFRQRYQRGDAKKIFYHDINPLVLAPGKYVIGVIQPTNTDYLFIHIDAVSGVEAKGVAFSADETYVQTQQGAGGSNFVGNPYIQAIFGHNAQGVSSKDVAVTKILRPVNAGVFAANEPVVAKVDNVGAENASNLVVYCKVDDKVYEKTVESLTPGQSVEVEFAVDLTQVGKRNLSVYTALEGDSNKANDTVSMEIDCQAAADPTKMDFENCADFAQTNFNPQWKSVDGDGQRVYSFDMDYTGSFAPGDPVGVFVLNTYTATGSFINNVSTHSGDKMGVTIAPSTANAFGEDWLISPALEINEKSELSIWTMQTGAGSSVTPSEIELYVSEKSDKVEDLSENFILSNTNAGIEEWQQTIFDLSDFSGKTVFLGIKIQQGATSILTMIDDIQVTNATVSNECDQVGVLKASIYPNPATTQVNINAAEEINSIEILSVAGQLVYQDNHVGSSEYRVNVEKLIPGVYFIRINSANGRATAKLVVR